MARAELRLCCELAASTVALRSEPTGPSRLSALSNAAPERPPADRQYDRRCPGGRVAGKDRKRQIARERYEKRMAARAQARAKAKRRTAIGLSAGAVIAIVAIVLLIVLPSNSKKAANLSSPASTASPSAAASSPIPPVPDDGKRLHQQAERGGLTHRQLPDPAGGRRCRTEDRTDRHHPLRCSAHEDASQGHRGRHRRNGRSRTTA